MRADECSRPCPSYPWGSSMTSPEVCAHLSSPEATNWSMVIWAPLTKSPNCASHMTSAPLCTTEYPYSKPPPYSDSSES